MADDIVLLERRMDGVAVVTLNSPKVNALSTQLLARLKEIADELTADPAGAVVLTGGDRLFAAGADIPVRRSRRGTDNRCCVPCGTQCVRRHPVVHHRGRQWIRTRRRVRALHGV